LFSNRDNHDQRQTHYYEEGEEVGLGPPRGGLLEGEPAPFAFFKNNSFISLKGKDI
jgi:hypothetical protein